MNDLLSQIFLGNTVLDYAIALVLFVLSVIVVKIIQHIVLVRLRAWSEKTENALDDFIVDLVQRIALPLAYVGALYFSVTSLTLDAFIARSLQVVALGILTIYAARFVVILVGYGFNVYFVKKGKNEALERSLNGILVVIKLIVWSLAIALFLDNLGFEISAVIAGLGIGGVAVALAAQAVLGDLFSYFAILFDRPFEIGDFIIIGDYLGSIEHIGIKTTRIRSLGGEQLVFSNTDLTNARVRNYKRMQQRRVLFQLGVTYETPVEKLKKIPKMIKDIITSVEDTTFDRAHFSSYGDFNLVIEIVYYVLGPDYNQYMDIQQTINFAIKGAFEKEGIVFAYPTQTLYVEQNA